MGHSLSQVLQRRSEEVRNLVECAQLFSAQSISSDDPTTGVPQYRSLKILAAEKTFNPSHSERALSSRAFSSAREYRGPQYARLLVLRVVGWE